MRRSGTQQSRVRNPAKTARRKRDLMEVSAILSRKAYMRGLDFILRRGCAYTGHLSDEECPCRHAQTGDSKGHAECPNIPADA